MLIKKCCLVLILAINAKAFCQTLIVNNNTQTINTVTDSMQYITGKVNPTDVVTINNTAVKVYKTGAFVFNAACKLGTNTFNIKVVNTKNKTIKNSVVFNYTLAPLPPPITLLSQSKINIEPGVNANLNIGDNIIFTITTLANTLITLPNGVTIPINENENNPQNYKLIYTIKTTDTNWLKNKFNLNFIHLKDSSTYLFTLPNNINIITSQNYFFVKTVGALPYLKESLGVDRLGSPRIGYIDTGIILKVIGTIADNYKIALNNNNTAYIDKAFTKTINNGALALSAINTLRCYGDNKYDYLAIGLQQKQPYKSQQVTNANGNVLEVDIYGAYNSNTWASKITTAKEITAFSYEQLAADHYKIRLQLKSKLFWGHSIYYKGNQLVIQVRRKPAIVNIANLIIGIDAGHGGNNLGAKGIAGNLEKNITVAITNKLIAKLKSKGITIITTRTSDIDVKNDDRLKLFLTTMPHLVISVHCNSAGGNPLRISGTSTYYKYSGFAGLSEAIYNNMLTLGLKEFGHVGNFNFILNSTTNWPNALVETAFISNPEDEEKLMDADFQNKIADEIINGIIKWLKAEQ